MQNVKYMNSYNQVNKKGLNKKDVTLHIHKLYKHLVLKIIQSFIIMIKKSIIFYYSYKRMLVLC